jgi:predicted deacylase
VGVILPPCVIVTAPTKGRLRRMHALGAAVVAGEVVGEFDGPGGTTLLRAPSSGAIGGALADVGQHIEAGEGLVWLHRR